MGRLVRVLFLGAAFASACTSVPVQLPTPEEVVREILPASRGPYRTAQEALNILIDRHVDRPTSQELLTGAMDGVDAQLARDGIRVSIDRPELTGSTQSDFTKFSEALDAVLAKVPDRPDYAKTLERAAADGMARSMDECHTYYLDPDRAKTFNRPPEQYSGIGATISALGPSELPQISAVFPNTPAERAGLRSGDRIKNIDGTDVLGFTAEEVATRIRGPEGTTVQLVLIRGSSERSVAVVRALISPPRAAERVFQDGTVGALTVYAFNGDVTRQTADAVQRLVAAGITSVVLDLRDNPGGDLSAAVDVASIFLRDATLVYQVGRDGERKALRTNDRWYSGAVKNLAVLVNERSASGAEIVAAGLRANGAATVVGSQTAGCVGIGQPRELPDGSLLLVTLARMQDARTGEELNGEGRGVHPDRPVAADPERGDPQLDAALAHVRGR